MTDLPRWNYPRYRRLQGFASANIQSTSQVVAMINSRVLVHASLWGRVVKLPVGALATALLVIVLFGLAACASVTRPTVIAVKESILLLPPLNVGQAGWCLQSLHDAVEGGVRCNASRVSYTRAGL